MKLADSPTLRAPSERRAAGVALVATVAAGLVVSLGLRNEQNTTLMAPYPLNGQRTIYPPINNAEYSRSCQVFRAYESGDAYAFCRDDRSAYRWLPDQGRWFPFTTLR